MLKDIRLLFRDFGSFFTQDFNVKAYIYFLLFVACSIALVYGTGINKDISGGIIPTDSRALNHLLRYGLMYYCTAIPILAIKREYAMLRNPKFYLKSFVFLLLFSFAAQLSLGTFFDTSAYKGVEHTYLYRIFGTGRYLFFVLPALVVMRVFFDKNVKGLYGLSRGANHVRAYLSLYIVVIPTLVFASFTPDFLSYYPMYEPWEFQAVFNRPVWLNTVLYEGVYLASFIMVELFFRGALVIGMAALLGRNAVLPMVAMYVALHFGKPALETVSAIFGGYFLGALAFQTRHIWGGVIIHMGIALMIELLRFFEHYVLGIG